MQTIDERKVRDRYRELTKLLIEKQYTITTMESITSGQIASLITDTEGASAVLKGAFVTYSNEAKIRQGVPREIIETYGVYSKETAVSMAEACREVYGADLSVGITGSTGNADPNNADSVPGEVYFAVRFQGELQVEFFTMGAFPDRLSYKLYAADRVAEKILEMIKGSD